MIICRGDGTLMISLDSGDVLWSEVSSPMESWCRQNGYKDVLTLEGTLNLDQQILPLPACKECPKYDECKQGLDSDIDELDNTYCTAVNEKATSQAILEALANLNEYEREAVLG